MARVRNIEPDELPPDLAAIYREFAGGYGPFRNQVAVFAHVPAALRHLMPLLLELRAAGTLPKRYLELAIVTVSKLNACDYCVAHHTPFLAARASRRRAPRFCPTTATTPSSTRSTSSSSNTRSPPGSARTAFPTHCSPACAGISARRKSSS